MLNVIMVSVVMLGVIMVSVVMLGVIMLSVVMQGVIMLSVVAPAKAATFLLGNHRYLMSKLLRGSCGISSHIPMADRGFKNKPKV